MSNSCILTFTGRVVDPLNLQPEDVDIRDIAHALSQQCRFTGHTRKFYSVAEHCLLVSSFCPVNLKLIGLLHDADEAYLIDLAAPVKHSGRFDEFIKVGKAIQTTVLSHFGYTTNDIASVKPWDIEAFEMERISFMHGGVENENWEPLTPLEAEAKYLECYAELNGLCKSSTALYKTS